MAHKNIEDRRSYGRKYRECHKEELAAYQRSYYGRNKDKRVAYLGRNKDKIATSKRNYRRRNNEKLVAYERSYRWRNKDKIAVYKHRHYERHKEKLIAFARIYLRAYCEGLADSYVRRLLRGAGCPYPVPLSLIRAKAAHLKVLRLLKQEIANGNENP